VYQYPGVTLVVYEWAFRDDQPFLSAFKKFQQKILSSLASRRESIIAGARLMEEHPGVSGIDIDVGDQDLAHLRSLEAPILTPHEYLHLSVSRVRIPVREDPSNIEFEILLKKGYVTPEKTIGQVVMDLPPPFVCSSWNGESVVYSYGG
jgi:hypothetical protein